jgi:serine protease
MMKRSRTKVFWTRLSVAIVLLILISTFSFGTFERVAEAQMPPLPSIASISPNVAEQGQTIDLTISGMHFIDGAKLSFFPPIGITINSVKFVSPMELRATIVIAKDAPVGSRDVTVTNPDEHSGTLRGGFTVKAVPVPLPPPTEEDLIEVMFAPDSKVRLRDGALVDLATNALAGVDDVLQKLEWFEWYRICDVPEEQLDEIQARGEANTGKPVYNLNNIYRLRIPMGLDVWTISEELAALPGIMLARPVPKPTPLPTPPNYVPSQGYLRPASSTPVGIDADYAWTQPGGNGAGVTVYDLEYSWNYNHADITKALGSQINPNPVSDPLSDDNHGTAVIGELVSDNNGWGTTGICYGASLRTCGTYYYSYSPYYGVYRYWWNPAGAIIYAIDDALRNQSLADVILLEQQWPYTGSGSSIPIEWYETYSPDPQTLNPVYAAIVNAVSNNIHVVEAGGNGNVNTDNLTWYGDSGAIIVGAGGVYPGGTWSEGNLERLSFSSYGSRFNLQGWGEDVVTTGYGNLYNAEGVNYRYTNTFSGTSSASPIVAGAIAVAEGDRLARGLPPLPPAAMRSLLVATGIPQNLSVAGNIGPLPNLAGVLPTEYYLTVGSSAGGSVAVQPPAPGPYAAGTVVTLTATPNAGYRFQDWSANEEMWQQQNPPIVNSPRITITINGNYTVTANFTRNTFLESLARFWANFLDFWERLLR